MWTIIKWSEHMGTTLRGTSPLSGLLSATTTSWLVPICYIVLAAAAAAVVVGGVG